MEMYGSKRGHYTGLDIVEICYPSTQTWPKHTVENCVAQKVTVSSCYHLCFGLGYDIYSDQVKDSTVLLQHGSRDLTWEPKTVYEDNKAILMWI